MGLVAAALIALSGCGKGDDNSPDMGAVAPKPNPGAVANAPGGGHGGVPSDMGASALGPGSKR